MIIEDWSMTALNTSDLSPKRRLEMLYEKARNTHVDDGVSVERYWNIANEILFCAKKLQKKNDYEESLLNYLRYKTMIKKLRSHERYRDLPLGKRASFAYKLKEVAKHVKILTELVFAGYKKLLVMADFHIDHSNFEGYQEQRPTISTVRTFISTPRHSLVTPLHPTVQMRARSRSIMNSKASSALYVALAKSSSSVNMEAAQRKSIFPTKQVKEFDELYKQRRTVRGHRTVVLPSRITTAFSYLSLPNTKKNLETVGYLAGRELNPTRLIVTHMLLPKQLGFSDYFKVADSTSLIHYLEDEDLMTIGWIHSHPKEIPYLSSTDMHYHAVFQNVLPEAVAVVYSPIEMRSVVFNLTPDHGLPTITSCEKKGFHTHPAKHPLTMQSHHTVTDLLADLTVQDFRNEEGYTRRDSTDTESGHQNLTERLLQVKTSIRPSAIPSKVRYSEVNFVHLDTQI
ncbi:STAM-binding protein-like [Harmonia axyridis]|uniref:STAM-binding protein-like n=1 Tax=Harmonia axyridis TaxID=115357 RepID=UPI001E279053|nr:STAM-binding protein-like [Harmonia axyridis]